MCYLLRVENWPYILSHIVLVVYMYGVINDSEGVLITLLIRWLSSYTVIYHTIQCGMHTSFLQCIRDVVFGCVVSVVCHNLLASSYIVTHQ